MIDIIVFAALLIVTAILADQVSTKWRNLCWAIFVLLVIVQAGLQIRSKRADETKEQMQEQKTQKREQETQGQYQSLKKTMEQMGNDIQNYIRNISPPAGVPVKTTAVTRRSTPPNPPSGLTVHVDDQQLLVEACDLARSLRYFLVETKSDTPTQYPGEPAIDYIRRSNTWYSNLMAIYDRAYRNRANAVIGQLIARGAVNKSVGPLAKDPVNFVGIDAVASALESGAGGICVTTRRQ